MSGNAGFSGKHHWYKYDKMMKRLIATETRHAPQFDFEQAPEELQELIRVSLSPVGPERSQWLNNYAAETWSVPDGEAKVLLAEDYLNAVRYLNRYFRKANAKLQQGGYFACSFDTAQKRRVQFFSKHRPFVAYILYFFDFLIHRVLPKLSLTKRLYYTCTKGVKKVYPRPEVLGRLYYCGFEVVAEQYVNDRYCVIAQKKQPPCTEPRSYGIFIKLKRVGKHGELFNMLKFRTMYAYSEYLQGYVYKNNSLDMGGKFKDDYRVTEWGRVLRRFWLDELPAFVNILKGEMKLVGVRPLSQQYFDLYSDEMQQLRTKTKPGLLPPYYVDLPETLEEIQESEKRYLDAYFEHPFRTNWKYFWAIIGNIVFKGKRSK